jgi:thiol-disulfide isomerase/thioredoxin
MKCRPRLDGLLLLLLLCALNAAGDREAAPRFTARTLKGQTFSGDALRGRVTLLQFWTTWCPNCKSDELAVDGVSREFSARGLVVLAVNAYESGEKVKKYLQENPRSCNIVLNEDTNLVDAFKPEGFPLYVLIDREGKIAGTQDGAGGDAAIRDLLSNAGLGGGSPYARRNADQGSSEPKARLSISPKLIEVPRGLRATPIKSLPPTVFVLKNGERLEVHRYTIMAGSLRVADPGNERTIALSALDLKVTIAANHDRGIDLKIPTNSNEIFLGP